MPKKPTKSPTTSLSRIAADSGMLPAIRISVLNQSTVVPDADVARAVQALQVQVTRDFRPAWGIDAELAFIPSSATAPKGTWQLVILDDSDQAGALGYHDLTEDGLPIGKVFAKTDLTYGNQWTVTASHELLELLADPDINLCTYTVMDGKPFIYAYESADACEADQYGYEINGVLVSDFVYPSWFEPLSPPGTKFDYQGKITKPLSLLPGGYLQYFDISAGTGWQQKTEPLSRGRQAEFPLAGRAHVGSRRERRRIGRDLWVPSAPNKKAMKAAFATRAASGTKAIVCRCLSVPVSTPDDTQLSEIEDYDDNVVGRCLNKRVPLIGNAGYADGDVDATGDVGGLTNETEKRSQQ